MINKGFDIKGKDGLDLLDLAINRGKYVKFLVGKGIDMKMTFMYIYHWEKFHKVKFTALQAYLMKLTQKIPPWEKEFDVPRCGDPSYGMVKYFIQKGANPDQRITIEYCDYSFAELAILNNLPWMDLFYDCLKPEYLWLINENISKSKNIESWFMLRKYQIFNVFVKKFGLSVLDQEKDGETIMDKWRGNNAFMEMIIYCIGSCNFAIEILKHLLDHHKFEITLGYLGCLNSILKEINQNGSYKSCEKELIDIFVEKFGEDTIIDHYRNNWNITYVQNALKILS